jgi:tripartite-type tricarboxylate transporter receptor subunit TctC
MMMSFSQFLATARLPRLSSRWFAISALGASLALPAAGPAHAADAYPSRPVKVVVNFAAGGPADVLARVLAEKLHPMLKQPFVVDNKPGSGGNIGAAAVAKSDPDGYTLLITPDSPLTVSPGVYPSMPFEQEELRPVMLLGTSSMAVAANSSLGAATMKELVAKGKSGMLAFSSAGNGSPGHLASAMLTRSTGAQVNHIPYRGNAPAVTALLSGEVQAGILALPGLMPHFKSGRLKPLAVTGARRSPLLPEVPTTAEAGFPEMSLELFYLVMAPARTPDAVVSQLQQALTKAMAEPDVRTRLVSLDFEPAGVTGPAVAERIARTRDAYGKIIKASGMKAE